MSKINLIKLQDFTIKNANPRELTQNPHVLKLVEALNHINDIAEPMHNYNELEFKMVTKVRKALAEWEAAND